MAVSESLFHITSWFTWADDVWPSGFLLPKAATGRPGISKADEEVIWISGVAYSKSRYVFLAPEHRRQRLARNYGRRAMAVLEFPIGVLEGRPWIAVAGREEQGGHRARSRLPITSIEGLAENLHRVEMILTPGPIPLSAVLSVEEIDPRQEDWDDVDDQVREQAVLLNDWWELAFPDERL
jgi:hypothetical protein